MWCPGRAKRGDPSRTRPSQSLHFLDSLILNIFNKVSFPFSVSCFLRMDDKNCGKRRYTGEYFVTILPQENLAYPTTLSPGHVLAKILTPITPYCVIPLRKVCDNYAPSSGLLFSHSRPLSIGWSVQWRGIGARDHGGS